MTVFGRLHCYTSWSIQSIALLVAYVFVVSYLKHLEFRNVTQTRAPDNRHSLIEDNHKHDGRGANVTFRNFRTFPEVLTVKSEILIKFQQDVPSLAYLSVSTLSLPSWKNVRSSSFIPECKELWLDMSSFTSLGPTGHMLPLDILGHFINKGIFQKQKTIRKSVTVHWLGTGPTTCVTHWRILVPPLFASYLAFLKISVTCYFFPFIPYGVICVFKGFCTQTRSTLDQRLSWPHSIQPKSMLFLL